MKREQMRISVWEEDNLKVGWQGLSILALSSCTYLYTDMYSLCPPVFYACSTDTNRIARNSDHHYNCETRHFRSPPCIPLRENNWQSISQVHLEAS